MPEFANPVFAALAQAMETQATDWLASDPLQHEGSAMREADYVHMLLERRVEGMVFICAEITDVRGDHGHYRACSIRAPRLVFVNGGLDSPCTSPSSGSTSGLPGASRPSICSTLGHASSASSPASPSPQATREKLWPARCALLEPPGSSRTARCTRGLHGRRRPPGAARADGAAGGDRPTGVICSNDLMAIGAVLEASALGLRVPDDLSIVGFDGIDAARGRSRP